MRSINRLATAQWALLILFATALDSRAVAETLKVANNGIDSTSCGRAGSPTCRSISQAIANALPGDTIAVNPGRYGDLNRDGDFNDPGDERAKRACVVCVYKSVRIVSTHGAAVTVIGVGHLTSFGLDEPIASLIRIRAANVTFGEKNAGFTLLPRLGSGSRDVRDGVDARGSNIRIAGNTAIHFEVGFRVPAPTGAVVLAHNRAVANGKGFDVTTGAATATVTLSNNLATDNAIWAFSFSTFYNGINNSVSKTKIVADSNLISGNTAGIFIATASAVSLQNNTIAGNMGAGVQVEGYGGTDNVSHNLVGNDALGNLGPGFSIDVGATAKITSNNIFGNDEDGRNCGILNTSGRSINATNNFWGRAGGPGLNRADDAGPGSTCDISGTTSVNPYSTQFFPIPAASSFMATSRVLKVANNGIDSPSCGPAGSLSCRSISQAINNAAAGDTIAVGPGRYGDLNNDGFFDDPGDERAELPEDGEGDFCIICIRKPIRLVATHGAAMTIIDAGHPKYGYSGDIPVNTVGIYAPEVSFGQKDFGFTVRGHGEFHNGVRVRGPSVNAIVAGNTVCSLGQGISYSSSGSGPVRLTYNIAVGNNRGINVSTVEGVPITATVDNNVSIANFIEGFSLSSNTASTSIMIMAWRNVAAGNAYYYSDDTFGEGFSIGDSPRIELRDNTSVGNSLGFYGAGTFSGNDAIGNAGPGFSITARATLHTSNIFGNDEGGANCGVVNTSGVTVDAMNNYWGRAVGGPGPNRADNAGPGSGCDTSGTTRVKPYATAIFPITR